MAAPEGTVWLLLAHGELRACQECWDSSTGSVRHTQDELGSLAAPELQYLGVDGMNPTPGMLGWRVQAGQVGGRFDEPLQSVMMVESLWRRIRAWKTKEMLQWVTPEKPLAG